MKKALDWKGTGLVPIKPATEKVIVFGKNLEDKVKTDDLASTPLFQFDSNGETSKDDDIETIKKRKFEAITGEEDEITVFQGDFKLFCWDPKTSNWIERGRGQLKLNDSTQDESKKSRLIMRLGGTLRLILNVSINHPQFKILTNSKTNIRFNDGQHLWAAQGQDAQVLKDLLGERIETKEAFKKIKPQPQEKKETVQEQKREEVNEDKQEEVPDDKLEKAPEDKQDEIQEKKEKQEEEEEKQEEKQDVT